MKKNTLLLIIFLFPILAFGQMSDSQVVEYVKTEHAKGTNQQAIGASLLQRGVTQSQLERIKQQTEQENKSNTTTIGGETSGAVMRVSQADEVIVQNIEGDAFTNMMRKDIFGKNIFNQKNLSFAPDVNIPTPVDYKLGSGDEVVIEIWGASQASYRKTISPEGTINIDNLGPIFLSGMTIESANTYIRNKFSSLYSGVDDSDGTSHIKLTLGQIRTIQINVMGEVAVPGTYSLSSMASIFHALYLAGGINDIGSLREINLYRNGKKVTSIDIYDYLLHGKSSNSTRISDGDIIIVPPYKSLVNISGQIKRPMYYEMAENETVKTLIDYAGGFVGGAYSDEINLTRKTGGYNKIFTINSNNSSNFNLNDGDIVTIGRGLDLYANRVQITGKVFRAGYYEIGEDISTVKGLIEKAGGLKEDAFLDRAILTREKSDLTLETLALNLNDILSGKAVDISLRKNDILDVAANKIETDLGDFTVFGMVANPGKYGFAENTTIKDVILKAGGLLSSASTAKVDVSRRILDPKSIQSTTILAETFTFSIEDGLVVDGKSDFILEPYDQVYIRRSPGYQTQRDVTIEGEILFPGTYTLEVKEQRISDLITQAGNITPHAFLEGARLIRQQDKDEKERQKMTLEMINRSVGKDSISMETLDTDTYYSVGIELNKAIANPKSQYDLVLRAGDRIIIPEFDNTIKINGAVMYPNTVLYQKGQKLNDYIEQAGGYSDLAEKKRAYIVYMNGTVAKAKGSSKDLLKPGCEIVVPTKEQKQKMTLAETIAIGSSVTSMASVVALLVNALTK